MGMIARITIVMVRMVLRCSGAVSLHVDMVMVISILRIYSTCSLVCNRKEEAVSSNSVVTRTYTSKANSRHSAHKAMAVVTMGTSRSWCSSCRCCCSSCSRSWATIKGMICPSGSSARRRSSLSGVRQCRAAHRTTSKRTSKNYTSNKTATMFVMHSLPDFIIFCVWFV